MRRTRRHAVNLWTAGFVSSALIQGVRPRWFARGTSWGYNQGWQREIAIWNLGTLVLIAALRREDVDRDRGLIAGFAVLSTLFGANHLDAALRSPRSWGNWERRQTASASPPVSRRSPTDAPVLLLPRPEPPVSLCS